MVNLFFITLYSIFLLASCQSVSKKNNLIFLPQKIVNGPDKSYIKPYINIKSLGNHKNYKFFLSENKGKKRNIIETAILKFDLVFQEMNFKLSADENLIALKTPITLLSINTKNKAILSLKLQNNIYWIEYGDKIEKVFLSLDYQEEDFNILQDENFIYFVVGEKNIQLNKIKKEDYFLEIGIIRSDLMRYRGLYIPNQILYIKQLQIK